MKEYISKHNTFSFKYPDNWTLEQEDNLITAYHANGVGALNISYYHLPDNYQINKVDELIDYIKEGSVEINTEGLKPKILDNEKFAYVDFISTDNDYWQYWIFSDGKVAVFVTYNCEQADKKQEIGVIQEITNSINILS